MLVAANIDKSQNIQAFLKGKVLKELSKGVATLNGYVYPSVLQSAAIPVLKKNEKNSIIIKYSEMSGIKLTYLLPIMNQQIKEAVTIESDEKVLYTMVLCHSMKRCDELATFANELTRFCSDVIDIVLFDQLDFQDVKLDWAKRTTKPKEESKVEIDEDGEEQKNHIKLRNKILFVTPSLAQTIYEKGLLSSKNSECFAMVLDKVNMH